MKRAIILVLFTLWPLALTGCFEQHGQDGDGERCGPVTCAEGQVCCNASCGICTAPGGGCIALACEDAGPPIDPPPRVQCGAARELCAPGATRCCPGCERGAETCPASDGSCPDLVCPEVCSDADERLCPSCTGGEPVCVPLGVMCPVCPPDVCEEGFDTCFDCDSGEPFCAAPGGCPPCDPMPGCETNDDCRAGEYCETLGCGAGGLCFPRPTDCDLNYEPVCGCDGNTYGNACAAAAAGVGLSALGECEMEEPCAGRDYCSCSDDSACAPLIDLSTGCVCECETPFACFDTSPPCACACGGATYLGCAEASRCATPRVTCAPGTTATLDPDGCPRCAG